MLQWTKCTVPVIASTIFHHFRLMFVILRKHASIKSSTQRLWPITAVRQVTRKFLLFRPVQLSQLMFVPCVPLIHCFLKCEPSNELAEAQTKNMESGWKGKEKMRGRWRVERSFNLHTKKLNKRVKSLKAKGWKSWRYTSCRQTKRTEMKCIFASRYPSDRLWI